MPARTGTAPIVGDLDAAYEADLPAGEIDDIDPVALEAAPHVAVDDLDERPFAAAQHEPYPGIGAARQLKGRGEQLNRHDRAFCTLFCTPIAANPPIEDDRGKVVTTDLERPANLRRIKPKTPPCSTYLNEQ